jgi:cytochrome bd ubiquinol oxidase subunit I
MHYPWWSVPYLTSPMLIAIIAVIHILVSHYAVGGGILLARETAAARRSNDEVYLKYLHSHVKFFVLLTVVFGAVTGVGIWWTIGLASPLATGSLIRTFVFGWGIEWVFFIIELVSAFIFLYYWDRLPPKKHVMIGWIYAAAAWISLVLITAITGFMLNTHGLLGEWDGTGGFWRAFLNLQFIPQTIYRTGAALILSSLYFYGHVSFTVKDVALSDKVQARIAKPAMLGAGLLVIGVALWFFALPAPAVQRLEGASVLNLFTGLAIAVTSVLFALIWLGPIRRPGWLTPGFTVSMLLMGVCLFATTEFIREGVRKPFIVHNQILGNQIEVSEIRPAREAGYLEYGEWTNRYVQKKYPEVCVDGTIDESLLLGLDEASRLDLGETLFMYHCNDCHAADHGYSALGPIIAGRSRKRIIVDVLNLNEAYGSMPPYCGTPEEAELLTDYLLTIQGQNPWDFGNIEIESEADDDQDVVVEDPVVQSE